MSNVSNIKVALHDGNTIDVEISGTGPTILLPVNPVPVEGPQAEMMRKWGADPSLGRTLIDGLSDTFQVIAFDYEGHVIANPKPNTLTPENIVRDFLAVADATGAKQFAYYGYSWLALSGLQLALRTDRLTALIMGGYPPLDGPYNAMLQVTKATHDIAVANTTSPKKAPIEKKQESSDEFDWDSSEITMSEAQTQQFLTLYENLQGFDDTSIQSKLTCPRLCFVGSKDEIQYGERWGNTLVDIAGPLLKRREDLEKLGWNVHVLDGMDHTQAMQAKNVLPIIRPWLLSKLVA